MIKRGQLTIFIILGLVLVTVIGLFLVFNNNTSNNQLESYAPEIQDVTNFIDGCVQDAAKDAALAISENGGHYPISNDIAFLDIPYYFKDDTNKLPTKEFVGQSIGNHITDNVDYCLNNFNSLSTYNVVPQEKSFSVSIGDNELFIDYIYKATISKDGRSYNVERFATTIPTRLGLIYNSASYLVDEFENTQATCVSCVYGLSSIQTSQKNGKMQS
jgi:hypothetical protein